MKQHFKKFRNRSERTRSHLPGLKRILFCMALILPLATMAQKGETYYYTSKGDKIPLHVATGVYAVQFSDTSQSQLKSSFGEKLTPMVYRVIDTTILQRYFSGYTIRPAYLTRDSSEIFLFSEVVLKFKEDVSSSEKTNLIKRYGLNLVKAELSYSLYTTDEDVINTSNGIYESGLVNFCNPNFIVETQALDYFPSDPYFNKQFYLYNTGQLINDGHYGTPGADIKATKAWDITKGSSSVTIAVIDEGVTSDHYDLPNTRQVRLNGSNFAAPFDGSSPNDPSPVGNGNHGNACAGIIGATQDNEGVTGISPLCKVMPVRIPFGSIPSNVYADAIDFANTNGADILSNSWGYNTAVVIPVIESAIQTATNDGKVVLFAAGNTANHAAGSNGIVTFPGSANVRDLITVGASDRNDAQANYSPTSSLVDIVAPSHKAYPSQISGESFEIWSIDIPGTAGWNPWKDGSYGLPALGEQLPSSGIHYLAYTGRMGGTSAATPEIAGVSALLLSENSCLTPSTVKDILQITADKVGSYNYNWDNSHPGQSKEMGYGRVNAYKAVKAAQELYSPNLDVYIKDVPEDFGSEPASYDNNTPLWVSSDIWTRNQDDGIEQHQNLQYDPNNPGFVYVKVRNKSCEDLQADKATLHVYFAKAGTFWANWPFPWTNIGGNPPVGGEIGYKKLPAIPAGGEKVISIPWYFVPNPQWYVNGWLPNEVHHFCILARIVSNSDPMYSELIGNSSNNVLAHNISYNNNVAMKNLSIVDFQKFRVDLNKWVLNDHAAVKVGTALSVPLNNAKLRFAVPTDENGNPITTDAEVKILLDPTIWNIWQNGGAQGSGFSIINPDAHELLVTEDVAELTNLNFPPQTLGNVAIQFNFLTEVQDEKNNFTYDLTQFNSAGEVLGGERFQIVRPARDESDMFEAGIDQNSLTAQSINEPATYSWYSADTTLIDTGMSFIVSPGQPAPAFLSVTADTDGYKDYVAINANSAANGAGASSALQAEADSIVSLSPNPASSQVMVQYHIGTANVQSAQLKVTYVNNPAVLQVVNLNPAQSQKSLNIGGYAPGVYIISLYVDGQQKDGKQLIIQ